jgi:signal transduction histidine kinase
VKSLRAADRARIESPEQTRALEREILHASEREQQRIGRDLHDSLGPHLAAIGYASNFLADDMRP